MLETRLTKLLGIKYPIQCGTMQGLSRAELVSAAANAGVLACIPAAMFPEKQDLLDEIKKTRDMTDQPFGVNVGLFPEMTATVGAEERINWVIESGVKILETAGRSPAPHREQISGAGLIHIHKCARVRDAVKVDGLGVDAVSIVGTECGGHPSMEGVTSLVLVPQAADKVKSPLIAGGGFSDGRSVIIALAMGASGVNMGTRFMATQECPVHQAVKDRMVESQETATAMVMQSIGNPMRVLRTEWTEKIIAKEKEGASLEELLPLISGKNSQEGGWMEGNVEQGMLSVGQVVGRINDIPTVADLVERIVAEAQETKKMLDGIL